MHQIVQVPLQLRRGATDAGSTRDDAHARGQFQLIHRIAQFLPIFALDAARYPTAAGIVGHQHQVATGQRDERRQGGALVAALLLFDLDGEFLAFLDRVLDACRARVDAVAKILARNLLEWQKAMAFLAITHEASFETRLNAGDDTFVNIGFALFSTSGFDVDVDEFLTIDDGDAQLFGVRRIKQHAFHDDSRAPLAERYVSVFKTRGEGHLARIVAAHRRTATDAWTLAGNASSDEHDA